MPTYEYRCRECGEPLEVRAGKAGHGVPDPDGAAVAGTGVGVGSGAFSYVGGAMYSTTFSLNHYCRRVEGGQTGITRRRALGLRERMRYDYLVRLFAGQLRRDYIERRYGRAFSLRLAPELLAMRLLGERFIGHAPGDQAIAEMVREDHCIAQRDRLVKNNGYRVLERHE